MNSFTNAINNQEARTANGMKALKATGNANTDLFFNIGASRGKNIIPQFVAAFVENEDYALRIAQWARDVRGGAGERQLFKDILSYLEKNDPTLAVKLITKIPILGRYDDMLIEYTNSTVESFAFARYQAAINAKDSLAAKWAPRKGYMAKKLRTAWDMSPKQYRKTIVNLTKVVETQMCDKNWDEINFSHVPSLAHSRYKTAFYTNAPVVYPAYVDALVKGVEGVKVNAGAVYPYDILRGLIQTSYCWGNSFNHGKSKTELDLVKAQWDALENYIGDADVFPMVDVSGSMTCPVGNNENLTCLEVAVSLGLYCADKNSGKFKDAFLTFSGSPEIINLRGDIVQKIQQITSSNWGMSTNLHGAFNKMLSMAVKGNVPASEMPGTLLIMSDMQFNSCTEFDDSAFQMIQRKYEQHGYVMPRIVFWNLNASGNAPVKFDQAGTGLISGFSPAIMKSVLAAKDFSPEGIMLQTIMDDKYTL